MPLSETILILMALLATGMLAAGIFRRLPIPYSVLLVIIGIGLNWASQAWAPLAPLEHFQLTPALVLFIFLPTLIFESGFNLNARQLIKDLAPVLTLAVPALLISTAAVGVGLWLLLSIDLTLALVFGALISATDPVAVVALFRELGTPQRLTVLVEGESLLNDATAIVVFNILLGMAVFGGISWVDAGLAVGQFIKVFVGGAIGGVLMGVVMAWLMTRLQLGTAAILILSVVMAYSSFILAEHTLHLSGVMAVAASAVTLGVIGVPRFAQETGTSLLETWEFLALVCNTLLFLLVGLSVNLVGLVSHLGAILVAVVLVQAVRAGLIYTLLPAATKVFRLPRVTMGERHIMSWGGLKGGLAIAIVLSIPEDLPGRQMLLDLTLGVVVFTLLVNAPTVRPLIRWLGIDRMSDEEQAELGRGVRLARGQADDVLYRLRGAGMLSRASHHQVRQSLAEAFTEEIGNVADEQRLRSQRLDTLRVELSALDELYQAGVIPQYTFLDLKGELQRKREHLVAGEGRFASVGSARQQNPFLRLENALIRRMREHDWAAPLLARYQSLRMSQHLIKDIAHTLMARAVLDYLSEARHVEAREREPLEGLYRERLTRFRGNIAQTRQDWPEFYARFERRLALRTALARALRNTEEEHRHGAIGAKAFTQMQRSLHQALDNLPPMSEPLPRLQPRDFVAMVPLLSGLPEATLNDVAGKSQALAFLAGDTVIGQGEHGDALYVVAKGRLVVSRTAGSEQQLAELAEGDFFGETALLGDQVRTANVRALQPCTLLRLTRKDVLELADRHAEIAERLEKARRQRVAENQKQNTGDV